MRVAIHGASGRMGKAIADVIAGDDAAEVVAALDEDNPLSTAIDADVVIDFTTPAGTEAAAAACARAGVPLVSGTTGLGEVPLAALGSLADSVPVVHAPNMSAGVTLLFHLAEIAAAGLRDLDAEIVEMHHHHKVDAPSGTAVRLAEHVARARGLDPQEVLRLERAGQVGPRGADEIGVMTLRGGAVVGDHTLHLVGEGERLELTHRAMDRSIFARGAVRAAKWIVAQPPGLYGMQDVLGLTRS